MGRSPITSTPRPKLWRNTSFQFPDCPLAAWYQTSLGQQLFLAEQHALQWALRDCYGKHLLLLGCACHGDTVVQSPVLHKICLAQEFIYHPELAFVSGDALELPFANDSIDVIVCVHLHEIVAKPHFLFDELARVLTGEGHCMILGFNPNSSWGLRRKCGSRHHAPWQHQFMSERKLRRMLLQTDCPMQNWRSYCFIPPLNTKRVKRLRWLDTLGHLLLPHWGAGYLAIAQKQIARPIMMPGRWGFRRSTRRLETRVE